MNIPIIGLLLYFAIGMLYALKLYPRAVKASFKYFPHMSDRTFKLFIGGAVVAIAWPVVILHNLLQKQKKD